MSLKDLARAHAVQIGDVHRALADCTVLAQISARCDDLETLLLSGLGWTKPQPQDFSGFIAEDNHKPDRTPADPDAGVLRSKP